MFTVGELAAALGMPMSDLVAGGMWDMGSVAAGELSATYAWDMYHEAPVASADALAARELTSWTVRFADGSVLQWPPPAPPVPLSDVEAFAERVRRDDLDSTVLTLDPPLPARDVARALGHPDAIGRSVDVHMSSWRLAGPAGEPLRLGRCEIEATLGGWASGPEVAGVAIPAAAVHHLGAGDVVLRIVATPPAGDPRST
jgi:hypothetical protein